MNQSDDPLKLGYTQNDLNPIQGNALSDSTILFATVWAEAVKSRVIYYGKKSYYNAQDYFGSSQAKVLRAIALAKENDALPLGEEKPLYLRSQFKMSSVPAIQGVCAVIRSYMKREKLSALEAVETLKVQGFDPHDPASDYHYALSQLSQRKFNENPTLCDFYAIVGPVFYTHHVFTTAQSYIRPIEMTYANPGREPFKIGKPIKDLSLTADDDFIFY